VIFQLNVTKIQYLSSANIKKYLQTPLKSAACKSSRIKTSKRLSEHDTNPFYFYTSLSQIILIERLGLAGSKQSILIGSE